MSSPMIYCSCTFCGAAQQAAATNSFPRAAYAAPMQAFRRSNVQTIALNGVTSPDSKMAVNNREVTTTRKQELKFGIENILYGSANTEQCGPNFTPQSTNRRPKSAALSRSVFTDHQRMTLENHFQARHYLSRRERYHLSLSLGLTEHQIKVWFQNRRVKFRNGQKAEEHRAKQFRRGVSQ